MLNIDLVRCQTPPHENLVTRFQLTPLGIFHWVRRSHFKRFSSAVSDFVRQRALNIDRPDYIVTVFDAVESLGWEIIIKFAVPFVLPVQPYVATGMQIDELAVCDRSYVWLIARWLFYF